MNDSLKLNFVMFSREKPNLHSTSQNVNITKIIFSALHRPFATNDHILQNPPCLRASSLLFPQWDIKTKANQALLVWVSLF